MIEGHTYIVNGEEMSLFLCTYTSGDTYEFTQYELEKQELMAWLGAAAVDDEEAGIVMDLAISFVTCFFFSC